MAAVPTIRLDDEFVLEGLRADDAGSHRTFAEDAAAARFFGRTVAEARAQPDVHYIGVMQRFRASRLAALARDSASGDRRGAGRWSLVHEL
jgi:hypothetical protein